MMKKVLTLAMLLIGVFSIKAQQPAPTQLPLRQDVKHGTLPNGLNYYILHNEEPKNRANFYIAQKVGSTLETPEQLGLAHFLEHMAFNGTEHYPGKTMLEYLQSKGIRFGADINAYTDFDETVYNINNVPANDQALMDSVLLVLHDWSGSILLEESEINSERGVIREEWRQRNSADLRMYEAMLPQIYQEYQYQQMPIGKMDIVMNFKPEVLRAYYKKWYRPDQQGIVIVGDFDAAEMEQKVIKLFSTIPMPENAAERTYPSVSDNAEPIFVSFNDPELQYTRVDVAFKYDKTPFELRNTDMGYVQDVLLPTIIAKMINNRLTEYNRDPSCPYAYAGVRFGNYFISKTKGAFSIVVVAKDDMKAAYEGALAVVARACKTGFTDSEMERARDEILANYKKALNEKDKTNNEEVARELIRHYIDNEAAPGVEIENQLAQMILTNIPVAAVNQVAASILTAENEVIVASAPEGDKIITKEVAIESLQGAMNAQYEAYVDEKVTEPLISKLPKKGKIKSVSTDATLGTTTFKLSNGAKVIVKPTDFASDEITMMAFEDGGKRSYAESQAANVSLAGDVYDVAKMGPFDVKMLRKYLAGKKVSLGYEVGNYTNVLNGSSTVADLQTLMELVYTSFTALSPDKAAYDAQISQYRSMLQNVEKDPQFVFQQHIMGAMYNNRAMQMPATVATLDAANYDEMFKMVTSSLSNAANFTFIFTGNVDPATLKPLLEQYIASLPSKKKADKVKDLTDLKIATGKITDDFKIKTQVPTISVYDEFVGSNVKFSPKNMIMMDLVGDVLDIIYTASLREEEGGTYGAQTGSRLNPNTGEWVLVYSFQTNPEQQQALRDRAYKELLDMLNNGAKAEHFSKVKEAAIKQLDINERNNSWWTNQIFSIERGFDIMTGYRQALESLTLEDLNAFMKDLYNGDNRIEVIMNGSPEF